MPCAGDSDEFCGGFNLLDLFSVDGSCPSPGSPSTPLIPPMPVIAIPPSGSGQTPHSPGIVVSLPPLGHGPVVILPPSSGNQPIVTPLPPLPAVDHSYLQLPSTQVP